MPDFHSANVPDQYRMGMVMERGVELAVEYRQGFVEGGRACLEPIPPEAIVAFSTFASISAGKGLRDLLLIGCQHIDTETAIALERRPGGRGSVDADEHRRTIGRK